MSMAQLGLQNVVQQFKQGKETLTILNDITVTFEQGKTYALTGVSGTGKSTMLQLLAGIEKPTKGAVVYNGKNYHQFSDDEQRYFLHSVIGLMFQHPGLIAELSVRENVMIKGLITGESSVESVAKADELLAHVGLSHKADAAPATLSGGEQQRVALARALFIRPQFLLADEPTAHLDNETKMIIIRLMLHFQQMFGMGIIIACHDIEISALMETQLTMQAGVICPG